MSGKRFTAALVLAAAVLHSAKPAIARDTINRSNALLCGSYSLSFSAATGVLASLSGSGAIVSDCHGNLTGVETTTDSAGDVCQGRLAGTYTLNANGTGTDSLSLIPADPSTSCPIVDFNEAIAIGQHGGIVKAINTGGDGIVTIQEEWVHQ